MVTFSDDAKDSDIEHILHGFEKDGGKVTHKYKTFKGADVQFGKEFDTSALTASGVTIEEDQQVHIN